MTQQQWMRVMGRNPSRTPRVEAAHPVETVSWDECMHCLKRIGLTLPTEAQWEYGARGGTSTPWYLGATQDSLIGKANVCDEQERLNGGHSTWTYEPWNDGFAGHAPVGSFSPNPFGLFDVGGNIWEWTLCAYSTYRVVKPAPGTGWRDDPNEARRAARGGSFTLPSAHTRSANRDSGMADLRLVDMGCRPSRPLID